jgi:hypothetical protein
MPGPVDFLVLATMLPALRALAVILAHRILHGRAADGLAILERLGFASSEAWRIIDEWPDSPIDEDDGDLESSVLHFARAAVRLHGSRVLLYPWRAALRELLDAR